MSPLQTERHRAAHRLAVIDALLAGEQVPAHVLAEYPDLASGTPDTAGQTPDTASLYDELRATPDFPAQESAGPEETPAVPDHDLDEPLAEVLEISKDARKALVQAVSEWMGRVADETIPEASGE